MGVINEISTEVGKTVREITKVSSQIIEKGKSQSELRTLKRNKDKSFKTLGKRVFAICEEGKELNKEELMDIIIQIENINEVIKNIRLEMDEREKEAKAEAEAEEFEYESCEECAKDDEYTIKNADKSEVNDVIH